MIWFTCKQCGKTHGRPETALGAMIFCECGLGLLVPWESTSAEPAGPPAAADSPPAPTLEPVTFDRAPGEPAPKGPRVRKRPRLGRRDPHFCFNHEESPRETACADCGENFCGACVVSFEGATLCGPCKNYRVKNLQRALPASKLALFSALCALVTPPVTLGLLRTGHPGFPWWSLAALVPQVLAAALALLALREMARNPKTGGLPLALTGLVSAGVATVVILVLMRYAPPLWT
jgi:hypothetical protein